LEHDPSCGPWTMSDYAALNRSPVSSRRQSRVLKHIESGKSLSVVMKSSTVKDPDALRGFAVDVSVI
jgi:hypothetical protein